ncbi:efflux RND transporter periplasmic adaptor subunit [Thetidibacter halocola]|uniref:Efflux RND transporter periplasmic adaptor subunit n=1 Tax=Thetidibacter halocola TaxID=2827239 RepID=A0A8J7W7Y5_9RHOB|nr:efflux RND transporter periplasmic adaptor subunit [Thetidibacter halocola]MBS0122635.1 efflux RND transporter periplasmic adaptor subunit [Thetidibacter halocola]
MRIGTPHFLFLLAWLIAAGQGILAETVTVTAAPIVEWKAVFGQVEARDRVPARARIGGTVVALDVTEGDSVTAGQRVALVVDDKLQFRINALDAQLSSLNAQRETATADLERGRTLIERGVITTQRLDQLQTAVDVIEGQISSLGAERLVVEQQIAEGAILSPGDGIVISVPISRGSVVNPGEAAAVVAGGGVFLRLSIPERHAGDLAEGNAIEIGDGGSGTLVKLYPQIEGGRVQADVEVAGLDGRFVGRRVPVRLPVGSRDAILVPEAALTRHGGLDLVTVETEAGPRTRAVVPGGSVTRDGAIWLEILTGLEPGETVVIGHE